MIQIIRSHERYHADHGWLSTWHHFSFNDYFDPNNVQFGPLRVFNEDIVQPSSGFPPHPHRDMEIVTYVLDGELEHQDNQGNRGRIQPGEVQVMSAGTGIVHAESNPSATTPLHLLQIWVLPRTRALKPRWEQQRFDADARRNSLLPVVTPSGMPAAGASRLQIDQDATFLVSALDQGKSLTHVSRSGRRAYLFAIAGALEVNDARLESGDQARITDEPTLTLTARTPTELILIDLP
ncbi:MAG TPA: pirin family protein [Methylomirabilota bacterium]|nr:pirin family protein [Methylomirabilota bacterium]